MREKLNNLKSWEKLLKLDGPLNAFYSQSTYKYYEDTPAFSKLDV